MSPDWIVETRTADIFVGWLRVAVYLGVLVAVWKYLIF